MGRPCGTRRGYKLSGMTNTPVLFHRAIEYLYSGKLTPFMETATECLEAAFETATQARTRPQQQQPKAATQPAQNTQAQNNPPARQNTSATARNTTKVDISNHTVAQPSREAMICILNRHYPKNKENLETWKDDKLFAAYRQGITNGAIPYDLSKGYLGGACPASSPPPQPTQSNYNPPPQKSAERLSTTVTNFVKNSPKYKNP